MEKIRKVAAVLASALALAVGAGAVNACKTRSYNTETKNTAAVSGDYFDRVSDPLKLMELETRGYHFGAVLPRTKKVAVNNKELFERNEAYKFIVDTINSDVAARVVKDPIDLGTRKKNHRSFDTATLVSPEATFELIGVFNRADLGLQFQGLCAGVRFIYRLAYKHDFRGRIDASRLPMTIAVNHKVVSNGADCQAYLSRWRGSPSLDELTSKTGALSGDFINPSSFQSIELNYQIQTWPSSVAEKMGAFAEYVFRVFNIPVDGSAVSSKLLSNTIDSRRVASDPALKAKLKQFLVDNAPSVARGTANIPPEFLATSISSFTPGGTARLSNRPFSQVFEASDFASIDYGAAKFVKSPEEMMERLNDLTCAGCHSGRSVNGFHYLGEERPNATHNINQLFLGFSEYSRIEKPRRVEILKARAEGANVDHLDLTISTKPPETGASYGSTCAMPAGAAKFPGWNCSAGLTCQITDEAEGENNLGKCYPVAKSAGDACHIGRIQPNVDPTLEFLKRNTAQVDDDPNICGGGLTCRTQTGGFPVGLCHRPCDKLSPVGDRLEACGPIAFNGFNACLFDADDGKNTFVDCLENKSEKFGRGFCDLNRPCRPDYFCAKARNPNNRKEAVETHGACVPSYFFFQLGVDAHPILSQSKATITLDFAPAAQTTVTAKSNAPNGALLLKRKPLQSGQLAAGESCSLPVGKSIGISRMAKPFNGHILVEIDRAADDAGCKDFGGLAWFFAGHAEFR